MSFSRWMTKQSLLHPDKGILFNGKKKWSINKWKKPILKGYTLYDSNYMTVWRGKTMEKVKRSVIARVWWESVMNKQSTEEFYGSENTLYDTIMMVTCHYTLVQTYRVYMLGVNFIVNYGILVIIKYHCKLINCNKYTTPGGMLITGEAMQVRRQEYFCVSSHFFSMNLKLL